MWARFGLLHLALVSGDLRNHFIYMGNVPRTNGTTNPEFFQDMVTQQTPYLIEGGTVVDNWPAMSWDFDSLRAASSEIVQGVYVNSQALFGPLFRSHKPLGSFASLIHRNPHDIQNLSAVEFFDRVVHATNENGSFVYYTGGLGSKVLAQDVEPIKPLIVGPLEHVNVWVGQANVTTHMHQDTYENFFVQIKGKKLFLLCPPEQIRSALPFPFLHPSHAQSQLHMDGTDPPANLRCWEAIVEPGQILYVPPLFWHHVVTLEPSISLNVWTTSKQQEVFNSMIHETVRRMKPEWTTHQKRGVFFGLLARVLDYVHVFDEPPINIPEGKFFSDLAVWSGKCAANQPVAAAKGVGPGLRFIADMLNIRYARLWLRDELPSRAVQGDCPQTISSVLTNTEEIQELTTLAKLLITKLNSLPLQSRSTWLGNFVESLALWAGGSGEGANELFNQCCRLL